MIGSTFTTNINLFNNPSNIRNISIIASNDIEKSCLVDNLEQKAGTLDKTNSPIYDSSENEQSMSNKLQSPCISLHYQHKTESAEKDSYLLNIIGFLDH